MTVKITVIGTGYVGLVSGACFAQLGHDVICVDKNISKIEGLKNGKIPIYEPELEEIVKYNTGRNRLVFSSNIEESVKKRDVVFLAVGTPSDEKGAANLDQLFSAASDVARAVDKPTTLVTKSTVPIGTNRKILQIVQSISQHKISVASNPEFLREGSAISDFVRPERIVIGYEDRDALELLQKIYSPLGQDVPLIKTKLETAEMIKYAANSFLAIKLSFINEVADLCEHFDANIKEVAIAIGLDSRIGRAFLNAGPGWGGSCFPKDTLAFANTARSVDISLRTVEAAITSNKNRKKAIAAKILEAIGSNPEGKRLGVLGLTFKGETDDIRESPSIEIIQELLKSGVIISAYDPSHPAEAESLLPSILHAKNPYEVSCDANAVVILTEWKEFKSIELGKLVSPMKDKLLIDFRNLFDPDEAFSAGFTDYISIGQKSRTQILKSEKVNQ